MHRTRDSDRSWRDRGERGRSSIDRSEPAQPACDTFICRTTLGSELGYPSGSENLFGRYARTRCQSEFTIDMCGRVSAEVRLPRILLIALPACIHASYACTPERVYVMHCSARRCGPFGAPNPTSDADRAFQSVAVKIGTAPSNDRAIAIEAFAARARIPSSEQLRTGSRVGPTHTVGGPRRSPAEIELYPARDEIDSTTLPDLRRTDSSRPRPVATRASRN